MQRYLLYLALAFIYVPKLNAKVDYPPFGPCIQPTISAIKGYWLVAGTPNDVIKKLEQNKISVVTQMSYDYNAADTKCVYLTAAEGFVNATFVSKNGNEPEVVVPYRVEEGSDGVLRGIPVYSDAPEHKWNWYSIFFKNGIGVYYVCSEAQGSTLPPFAAIVVKKGSSLTGTLAAMINPISTFLEGLGFKFKNVYNDACLSDDSLTTPSTRDGLL